MRTLLYAVAMVVVTAGDALPCGSSDVQVQIIDPAYAADTTPPAIHGVTYEVRRVEETTSNCGPGAWIAVTIDADDDAAPRERLAYRLVLLPGGAPPVGLPQDPAFGNVAIVASAGYFPLRFALNDKVFDFQLSVRAVDLNGNESEPAVVEIVSDGSEAEDSSEADDSSGACSTGSGGTWPLALGAAWFVSRRRRSRARLRQCRKLRSS